MKIRFLFASALATILFSTHVLAVKVDMTPGLWEHTFKMISKDGEMAAALQQMQKAFAAMPPEQRKMMEDMMAKKGMSLGANADGATTFKVCVTQEDIDRGYLPQQKNCTQEILERSSNTFKVKFECDGTYATSGIGEVIFSSPKAYTGKTSLVRETNGKKDEMQIQQAGKWLSADCGDIKPVQYSAE